LNILALDTASGQVTACLLSGKEIYYAAANAENDKPSSVSLSPRLAELLQQAGLQWADLDAFAIGQGPGSFTGLRIGAATIAGLNSGLNRPILPISSLAITALQTGSSKAVYVFEDARAGEMFVGQYQAGKALQADSLLPLDEVASLAAGLYAGQSEPPALLNGWQRLPLSIARELALALAVRHAVAEVDDWQQLPIYPQPVYMQPSQAERNARV